jgi:hypothetical protein
MISIRYLRAALASASAFSGVGGPEGSGSPSCVGCRPRARTNCSKSRFAVIVISERPPWMLLESVRTL